MAFLGIFKSKEEKSKERVSKVIEAEQESISYLNNILNTHLRLGVDIEKSITLSRLYLTISDDINSLGFVEYKVIDNANFNLDKCIYLFGRSWRENKGIYYGLPIRNKYESLKILDDTKFNNARQTLLNEWESFCDGKTDVIVSKVHLDAALTIRTSEPPIFSI